MFNLRAGVSIVHVPYKGTVLALNDLLGGRVQLIFSDMPIALPHAKSGKLRALAVTTPKRTSLLPEMPTVAESGLPGFALENWWGLLAPRGVPREIVAKLNSEIAKALKTKDLQEFMAREALDPVASSPEQLQANFKREIERYAKIIKAGNITVE